ncbi:FAD-binding protein [Cephaloticoccus primus]|uniref:assimilatory sulfite reductase (NADPH) n=1 Tax=Cephaloticoccus primus TaxID=1548207 RepID=A0A139SR90_9BACT|nr:sulfite reductase subunit alpha [Cephaloticoccus primus]KXU36971.1 FAD-binding protein [Cephaloticoccus primus]
MSEVSPAAAPAAYNRDNPFLARLVENRMLSRPGSGKETRHMVVDLGDSGLTYKPGDSLGIYGLNRDCEVDEIIERLGATGEEPVTPMRATAAVPLRQALTRDCALAGPTKKTVEIFAGKVSDPAQKAQLEALLAPEAKPQLEDFLYNRAFVDFLAEYPSAKFEPQEFVAMLRRLVPRLYSIASSQRVYPGEVHLTVAVVRYETNGRERVGVCTSYLADRVPEGERVPVFVSHSHFGPPADLAADCIMVGPGTGIAPFRAFVQDRLVLGATGRNWVFFGEQHAALDYLYQDEWEDYVAKQQVQRLDLAWSRDQAQKIYVQDRMRANAAELWAWLEKGAYFYVCGDAKRMAKDVDAALHEIIATQGGLGEEGAVAYVKQMKKDKRYQRDVY